MSDSSTPASNLVITASSSNPTLVPNANIILGGNGTNRTVTVTPALGQAGQASITLMVSDGTLSTWASFVLTVFDSPPTISSIAGQNVAQDHTSLAIPFTVGDLETPAADLIVTASSSSQTLVPNANIVAGGSGASRNVTITPAYGQSGTATITVNVSDSMVSTSTSFILTVLPVVQTNVSPDQRLPGL